MTGDSGSFSRARRRTGANPNRTSAPRKTNTQAAALPPAAHRPPKNQHQNDLSTTPHVPPPFCKSVAHLRPTQLANP